jgi:hypothetical protein
VKVRFSRLAEMLDWLVQDQGIEPHIPVIDKSERIDGTFSRSDFAYDHAADLYRCPGGKELKQYRRAFRGDHPDTRRIRPIGIAPAKWIATTAC